MIEAGVLLDKMGRPIYWHSPKGRDTVSLPDSTDLWKAFWLYRNHLSGFAHSHPGDGIPSPSHTDLTTFAAIEAGLGKRLDWWIINRSNIILIQWDYSDQGQRPLNYRSQNIWTSALPWVEGLQNKSRMED